MCSCARVGSVGTGLALCLWSGMEENNIVLVDNACNEFDLTFYYKYLWSHYASCD